MAVAERTTSSGAVPSANQIAVKNPVTSEVIGHIPVTPPDEVRAAVDRARHAQKAWGALTVKERAAMLRHWGDLLWDDHRNAMRIIRDETGKVDTGAYLEVLGIIMTLDYYVPHAPRILKPQRRNPIFPGIQYAKVHYKPYGVVGMISPWNYPFFLPLTDAIPALIAGNTVVFKPSEITPFSVLYAIDLMHKAGIPRDVVQVVTGDGSTGAALVDEVDYIAFTGSTPVGKKIAVRAAERLIPYSLELGGKDAMIVLRDANIDMAAAGVFVGGVENAGQMCISVERVYVEDAIYDQFLARVQHYANELVVGAGDGLDVHVGSMTNERELTRVERHVEDALAKGAKLIHGGRRRPDLGPLFYEPAVLVDVDHSMAVMREETFGPVIPIMRVRDAEEALRLANDSEYGLSGTVWTRDFKRGEEIAQRMETGDVGINRAAAQSGSLRLPWGGRKQSGVGRRGGPEGLLRYVSTQTIIVDRMIGSKPGLTLLDPVTHQAMLAMRRLRRMFPYI
ncbi:MAG: succinic semialdehyde dehydrogenase [bacterium]|nr:succinic semialdehyde dehydrogenase [bacterium]